jgi:hypothetical protein
MGGHAKYAGSLMNRDGHAHIVAEQEEAAGKRQRFSTRKDMQPSIPHRKEEAPTYARGGNSSAQQSAAVDNDSSIVERPHEDQWGIR